MTSAVERYAKCINLIYEGMKTRHHNMVSFSKKLLVKYLKLYISIIALNICINSK